MNKKERIYYLMGLEDAINELKLEIEVAEKDMGVQVMEQTPDVLIHHKYALRCGIMSIRDLIEAVKNGI